MHGDADSAKVNDEAVQLRVEEIKKKLKIFERQDIFNFDETGLFYKQHPTRTISGQVVSDLKTDKMCLTVGLLGNSNGLLKFDPIIIEKHAKPLCFNKKTGFELGFQYFNNKSSWMTKFIFAKAFHTINIHIRNLGRKVLILLDNATCHDTSSFDAGIIQNFKVKYWHFQYQFATLHYIANKSKTESDYFTLTRLQEMNCIMRAWRKVTSEIITNCFKHTGLFHDIIQKFISPVIEENFDDLNCLSGSGNITITDIENLNSIEESIDILERNLVSPRRNVEEVKEERKDNAISSLE
ncbi:hypothetical protein PHYBLDRAFT_175666 [Phycomyces blakesleeanus NRRL 1555(-)]|uniref:DDE-1 domain-containing protein n=1 Tax=Phycomyces blakesleeanus (strain ATCC 8743b / DSM 1359 / FGSC 10004 / NBRC 33097 / NRRL 1555) TaxID=763407 RepID=A0A162WAL7_PHYB8|nr:hypothetical protein PHYBLDRAFT_175666 [Phycomyces blakesleeanus NRRL 1555(-)]OAD65925.1 hypothetical protein PHYBLDRAFT_175666 [Phycomyces blakesleeanus NRRL 1555(-)]|eukprot:XP_018283965.1 hypothetical protein PHYBLDRAFT_175666 [Phycomyces blakesleeanus NRRL 1555(-)]